MSRHVLLFLHQFSFQSILTILKVSFVYLGLWLTQKIKSLLYYLFKPNLLDLTSAWSKTLWNVQHSTLQLPHPQLGPTHLLPDLAHHRFLWDSANIGPNLSVPNKIQLSWVYPLPCSLEYPNHRMFWYNRTTEINHDRRFFRSWEWSYLCHI